MKIKVMIKEPYEAPYEAEIENTLEEFQRIVDGYIETIPCPFVPNVDIVCNEEGKIKELVPNLLFMNGISGDVICGTVIAVGVDGEEFVSLTEKQRNDAWLSLMIRAIHTPETIRRVTGYADGV